MFGNRKLNKSISIKINKEALDRGEVTKCLGILNDDKLTWKNHISLEKSKLSKCCAFMYIMIGRCGLSVLYHTLFLPYIMYCVEIWDNTYATMHPAYGPNKTSS